MKKSVHREIRNLTIKSVVVNLNNANSEFQMDSSNIVYLSILSQFTHLNNLSFMNQNSRCTVS